MLAAAGEVLTRTHVKHENLLHEEKMVKSTSYASYKSLEQPSIPVNPVREKLEV